MAGYIFPTWTPTPRENLRISLRIGRSQKDIPLPTIILQRTCYFSGRVPNIFVPLNDTADGKNPAALGMYETR